MNMHHTAGEWIGSDYRPARKPAPVENRRPSQDDIARLGSAGDILSKETSTGDCILISRRNPALRGIMERAVGADGLAVSETTWFWHERPLFVVREVASPFTALSEAKRTIRTVN